MPKTLQENINKKKEVKNSGKRVEISMISLLILSKPSKNVLEKSEFYKGKGKELAKNTNT